MKTPLEVIKELIKETEGNESMTSLLFIQRCMTDYAKLVQEEQITQCAISFNAKIEENSYGRQAVITRESIQNVNRVIQ